MTKSAYIIYNPRAGRPREREMAVAKFSNILQQNDFRVTAQSTQHANHATELARQAVAEHYDVIIANGGDGTLNEVLQGMVGSDVPLAVWPGGTANVVALDLKLPRTPESVAALVIQDHREWVSIGRAGSRYFFFTAGIGLDAEVINAVNAELKKRLGKGAFWIAGFSHLVRWQPTEFTLHINDNQYTGTFAVIGNSFGYGGTFSITPHARMNDDMLDVCIFSGGSKLQYVNYLVACLMKTQLECEGVTYVKTRRIEAISAGTLPVQLDGEVCGELPMSFEVVPKALSLIVPPNTF